MTAILSNSTFSMHRWPAHLLAVMLLAGPTMVSASDYPPPPGAYRSEPLPSPSPPAMLDTTTPETETTGAKSGSSSVLPLPLNDEQSREYDADVLFGAAQPPQSADRSATPPSPGFPVDFSRPPERIPPNPAYDRVPRPYGAPPPYWNQAPYYPPAMGGGMPRYPDTMGFVPGGGAHATNPMGYPASDPPSAYPEPYDDPAMPSQDNYAPAGETGPVAPRPTFRPSYP